ncbi:Aspartic peptidase, family A2 [Croceitalea dokdonensis DOKDO 023]|uniref:Aspartic peptidase, family A2 n=1 Tax=Croceitalea dokdonensis DOKDO 023 TaxID=1300341 RepID=A0A0P7ASA0_9FLAO|nr:retropepsin-like aspartic protease [Croceitalea dokdonensis]KPM31295.1 Aspartic peptidase, family A2 [Croceitalea dokdonensis DOKDO 023]
MKKLKSFLRSKNYCRIPLRLKTTNHFELTATLNGTPGRFILDTGASNTCVGLEAVEQFKLQTQQSPIKAAGAGATDMKTLLSKKNRLEIGEWFHPKQKIVLFDLGHVNQALLAHHSATVDGIIGADILKKGKAIIDYKKRALYLRLPKNQP